MRIIKDLYPGGKTRALTMGYDDGQIHDRRLVDLFNQYGIRGTFFLNSGRLNRPGVVESRELPTLYANHEVAVHTLTHPSLALCPREEVIEQVMQDRANLEQIMGYTVRGMGYTVRGMGYPNGSYSPAVIEALRACGIAYCRTSESTYQYKLPAEFLTWHFTCRHQQNSVEYLEKFLSDPVRRFNCMYVFGHSFEFPRDNNWHVIEEFCKRAAGHDEVWYATNIEIYDYIQALGVLQCSADRHILHNPCAIDVWVSADGEPVHIPGGQTVIL